MIRQKSINPKLVYFSALWLADILWRQVSGEALSISFAAAGNTFSALVSTLWRYYRVGTLCTPALLSLECGLGRLLNPCSNPFLGGKSGGGCCIGSHPSNQGGDKSLLEDSVYCQSPHHLCPPSTPPHDENTMNNFGVIEVAGAKTTAAPGWAYVPDVGPNASVAAIQPTNRKRAAARSGPNLSLSDLSARQEAKIRKELEALDRDSQRDAKVEIPAKAGASKGLSFCRLHRPSDLGLDTNHRDSHEQEHA